MKVTFALLLTILTFNTYAQSDTTSIDSTNYMQSNLKLSDSISTIDADTAKVELFRKNVIKVNLSSYALYNNSISFERSITRKISLVAGYRYMPQTSPNSAFLIKEAESKFWMDDDELKEDINSTMIGNNTFTGEVRFYAGKKPGAQGFYLSLYGRYMNMTASIPTEYETDTKTYPLTYSGTLKGFGGGAMIGAQWLIAKRITFDWYIIGGHYGKIDIDMPAVSDLSTMTTSEKRSLEEDIESINAELRDKFDINADANDQGVEVTGTAPYLGIRGLGFNLGIAF